MQDSKVKENNEGVLSQEETRIIENIVKETLKRSKSEEKSSKVTSQNPPKLPQKKKSPTSFSRISSSPSTKSSLLTPVRSSSVPIKPTSTPIKSSSVTHVRSSQPSIAKTTTLRTTNASSRSGRESKSSSPPDLERISPPTNYKRLSLQNQPSKHSVINKNTKSTMKVEPQVKKTNSSLSLKSPSSKQTASDPSFKRTSSTSSANTGRRPSLRNTVPLINQKSSKIASESLAQRAKTTSEERLSKFRKNMTRSNSIDQKFGISKRKLSLTSTASESDQVFFEYLFIHHRKDYKVL